MVWHEITVHLPLTLLESTYNFLWPYVNGITVKKLPSGFLMKTYLRSPAPDRLVKKLHSFLKIQAKSRSSCSRGSTQGQGTPSAADAKSLSPSVTRRDALQSEEFIIVPIPTSDIPPFGIPIFLRRGRAFGIGSHPCTIYCLDALIHIFRNPDMLPSETKFLDAGTGTGILSIAAVKLGAEDITCAEISLESLNEARDNMSLNGITRGIVIRHCSVTEIQEQFDIILANLYGFLLAEIAPSLVRLLAPAGQLVLGGMAVPHDDEVTAIYQHYGLKEQVRYRDEEWGTAVLHKV
ncbi:MAG: 50S ribosomal protein L11 methyltransferase [Nitrospirota bacterium]